MIHYDRWQNICKSVWDYHTAPPSGIVFMYGIQADKFFRKCQTDPNFAANEYIIVSGSWDGGPCYQRENEIVNDIYKSFSMIDFQIEYGYHSLVLSPRCNLSACSISDKFSAKTYSFTSYTFEQLPPNVKHWYTVNANVNETNISPIPFGCERIIQDSVTKKDERLYLNFSDWTLDRVRIKRFASANWDFAVIREKLSVGEYIGDICRHQYILCMPGNGLDCYRTWEVLQTKSIPVVQDNYMNRQLLDDLPVIFFQNPYEITLEWLQSEHNKLPSVFNTDKLRNEYWQSLILST